MRNTRTDPPPLYPPKMNTLGAFSFTPEDRKALSAWLAQDGWPRGTMNMIMLEGYLVALLAWPVRVQPGVWLPPIWGQTGWKVAPKIDSPSSYLKFIELVVGLLEHLDRGLCGYPPCFTPALPAPHPGLRHPPAPAVSWAQGFLKALRLSATGFESRSDLARSALMRIARYASSEPTPPGVAVADEITSAVVMLATERDCRGPLGGLPSR